MQQRNTYFSLLVALLFGSLLSLSAQAAEMAAKVLFVSGEVTATDASGNARTLSRGDPIWEGDDLNVAVGALQLAFLDGAFLALEKNSHLRVDEYAPPASGRERVFLSQKRGSLRTVTGSIGKRDQASYKLTTPVAVVGVRGTGYRSTLCQQGSCRGADGQPIDDGIYLQTNAGTTSLTTTLGTQLVQMGQTGFSAGMNSMPMLSDTNPAGAVGDEGAEQQEEQAEETNDNTLQEAVAAAAEQLGSSGVPDALASHADVLARYLPVSSPTTGGDYVVAEASVDTTANAALIPAAGLNNLSSQAGYLLTDSANGSMLGYYTASPLRSFSSLSARHMDGGSDTLTGATWGRWDGSYSYYDGITSTGGSVGGQHYVYAMATPAATIASRTGFGYYFHLGGTPLTASDGSSWTLSSSSVMVDFTQAVVDGSLYMSSGSLIYSPAYLATLKGDGTFATTLHGTCGPGTCSGSIAGALVGSNAEGVVGAFNVIGSGGPTVSGALVHVSETGGGLVVGP